MVWKSTTDCRTTMTVLVLVGVGTYSGSSSLLLVRSFARSLGARSQRDHGGKGKVSRRSLLFEEVSKFLT